jgi:hypothetical protein
VLHLPLVADKHDRPVLELHFDLAPDTPVGVSMWPYEYPEVVETRIHIQATDQCTITAVRLTMEGEAPCEAKRRTVASPSVAQPAGQPPRTETYVANFRNPGDPCKPGLAKVLVSYAMPSIRPGGPQRVITDRHCASIHFVPKDVRVRLVVEEGSDVDIVIPAVSDAVQLDRVRFFPAIAIDESGIVGLLLLVGMQGVAARPHRDVAVASELGTGVRFCKISDCGRFSDTGVYVVVMKDDHGKHSFASVLYELVVRPRESDVRRIHLNRQSADVVSTFAPMMHDGEEVKIEDVPYALKPDVGTPTLHITLKADIMRVLQLNDELSKVNEYWFDYDPGAHTVTLVYDDEHVSETRALWMLKSLRTQDDAGEAVRKAFAEQTKIRCGDSSTWTTYAARRLAFTPYDSRVTRTIKGVDKLRLCDYSKLGVVDEWYGDSPDHCVLWLRSTEIAVGETDIVPVSRATDPGAVAVVPKGWSISSGATLVTLDADSLCGAVVASNAGNGTVVLRTRDRSGTSFVSTTIRNDSDATETATTAIRVVVTGTECCVRCGQTFDDDPSRNVHGVCRWHLNTDDASALLEEVRRNGREAAVDVARCDVGLTDDARGTTVYRCCNRPAHKGQTNGCWIGTHSKTSRCPDLARYERSTVGNCRPSFWSGFGGADERLCRQLEDRIAAGEWDGAVDLQTELNWMQGSVVDADFIWQRGGLWTMGLPFPTTVTTVPPYLLRGARAQRGTVARAPPISAEVRDMMRRSIKKSTEEVTDPLESLYAFVRCTVENPLLPQSKTVDQTKEEAIAVRRYTNLLYTVVALLESAHNTLRSDDPSVDRVISGAETPARNKESHTIAAQIAAVNLLLRKLQGASDLAKRVKLATEARGLAAKAAKEATAFAAKLSDARIQKERDRALREERRVAEELRAAAAAAEAMAAVERDRIVQLEAREAERKQKKKDDRERDKQRLLELEASLRSKADALDQAKQRIATLDEQIASVVGEQRRVADRHTQQLAQLRKTINDAEAQSGDLGGKLEQGKAELQRLGADLNSREEEVRNLKAALEALSAANGNARESVQLLQAALDAEKAAHHARQVAMQQQEQELTAKLEALGRTSAETQAANEQLRLAANEQLRVATEERLRLVTEEHSEHLLVHQQRLDELQQKLDVATKDSSDKQAQLAATTAALRQATAEESKRFTEIAQALDSALDTMSDGDATHDDVLSCIKSLVETRSRAAALDIQNADLQQKLVTAETHAAAATRAIETLRQEHAKIAGDNAAEIADLKERLNTSAAQLEQARREIDTISGQLSTAHHDKFLAEGNINTLRKTHAEEIQRWQQQDRDLAAVYSKDVESRRFENRKLQEELDRTKVQLATESRRATEQAAQALGNIAKAVQIETAAKAKESELNTTVADLQSRVAQHAEARQKYTAANAELSGKQAQLIEEVKQAKEETEQLRLDQRRAAEKLATAELLAQQTSGQLGEKKEAHEAALQEVERLKQELQKADESSKEAARKYNERHAALQKKIEQSEAEFARASKELTAAKSALEEKAVKLRDALKDNATLKERVAELGAAMEKIRATDVSRQKDLETSSDKLKEALGRLTEMEAAREAMATRHAKELADLKTAQKEAGEKVNRLQDQLDLKEGEIARLQANIREAAAKAQLLAAAIPGYLPFAYDRETLEKISALRGKLDVQQLQILRTLCTRFATATRECIDCLDTAARQTKSDGAAPAAAPAPAQQTTNDGAATAAASAAKKRKVTTSTQSSSTSSVSNTSPPATYQPIPPAPLPSTSVSHTSPPAAPLHPDQSSSTSSADSQSVSQDPQARTDLQRKRPASAAEPPEKRQHAEHREGTPQHGDEPALDTSSPEGGLYLELLTAARGSDNTAISTALIHCANHQPLVLLRERLWGMVLNVSATTDSLRILLYSCLRSLVVVDKYHRFLRATSAKLGMSINPTEPELFLVRDGTIAFPVDKDLERKVVNFMNPLVSDRAWPLYRSKAELKDFKQLFEFARTLAASARSRFDSEARRVAASLRTQGKRLTDVYAPFHFDLETNIYQYTADRLDLQCRSWPNAVLYGGIRNVTAYLGGKEKHPSVVTMAAVAAHLNNLAMGVVEDIQNTDRRFDLARLRSWLDELANVERCMETLNSTVERAFDLILEMERTRVYITPIGETLSVVNPQKHVTVQAEYPSIVSVRKVHTFFSSAMSSPH